MKEIVVTHKKDKATVVYDEAKVIEPDVSWLSDFILGKLKRGRSLDGEIFHLGSLALCAKRDASEANYTLVEPDCTGMPLTWTPGATNTLGLLRLQRNILDSFHSDNIKILVPTLDQSCIACTKWLDDSELVGNRQEPEGVDSGWFIGCNFEEHDHDLEENLVSISVYEVVCGNPRVAALLGLPPKSEFVLTEDSLQVFFKGMECEVRDGSYVASGGFFEG